MEKVALSEFNDWLNSPVTKAAFEVISEEAERVAHGLSQGAYVDDPQERIYMGYVRALREVVTPDNLQEEIVYDDES